jgi:hypothetical protein
MTIGSVIGVSLNLNELANAVLKNQSESRSSKKMVKIITWDSFTAP